MTCDAHFFSRIRLIITITIIFYNFFVVVVVIKQYFFRLYLIPKIIINCHIESCFAYKVEINSLSISFAHSHMHTLTHTFLWFVPPLVQYSSSELFPFLFTLLAEFYLTVTV